MDFQCHMVRSVQYQWHCFIMATEIIPLNLFEGVKLHHATNEASVIDVIKKLTGLNGKHASNALQRILNDSDMSS